MDNPLNGQTDKAWPSYQTIADATGKSIKTIQCAVRELERPKDGSRSSVEMASGTPQNIVPQQHRFYAHRAPRHSLRCGEPSRSFS